MKRYLKYISYVVRHKWYVMLECFKIGLYKEGILHDLSKFLPSEFIPYARHFFDYNGNPIPKKRDNTGYYKPTDTVDDDFDYAWFLHQKRNSHHWQYWALPEEKKGIKLLPIPKIVINEMICDWKGASKAQKATGTVLDWYNKNKDKMQLYPYSRKFIEVTLVNLEEG